MTRIASEVDQPMLTDNVQPTTTYSNVVFPPNTIVSTSQPVASYQPLNLLRCWVGGTRLIAIPIVIVIVSTIDLIVFGVVVVLLLVIYVVVGCLVAFVDVFLVLFSFVFSIVLFVVLFVDCCFPVQVFVVVKCQQWCWVVISSECLHFSPSTWVWEYLFINYSYLK